MTWRVLVRYQKRGTAKEGELSADFQTREQAIAAVQKLENDIINAEEHDIIVVDSGDERFSFVKQDFRTTQIFQAGY